MGILFICSKEETTIKMKGAFIVCLAALAAAEPEADAGLLGVNTLGLGYSNLGLSTIASPIGYSNLGLSAISSPLISSPIISNIAAPALISSPAAIGGIWKREAEAEPEADPSLLGINTLGYSNLGLPTIASPIGLSALSSPIGLPAISQPIATSYASPIVSGIATPALISSPATIGGIWKREAEAEPEADAGLLGVNTLGLGYSSLGLSTIASPIGYSTGLTAISSPLISTYSSPIISNIAATPIISSPATLGGIWKREAEAEPEADPSLLGINTLGYNNLGLSTIASPIGYSKIGLSTISRPIGYSNIGLSTLSSPIVSRIATPSIISRPIGLGRLGLW